MDQNDDIAIQVKNVSKTFRLPHEKHTSLKGLVLSGFRNKKIENQKALNNVSFEVKKGEFFGIVGRNGSGKSTLLKCIAGVYTPTAGSIKVNGTLVPFIELGVGFNPELTGRDNVFLNGALLGFSRPRMEEMYDEIVEFAELSNFMDQKLKNYSSGMQVRLAFSIAIRAKGDILLIDEVLAVGDAAFQQKCLDHFSALKRAKKTIILVTHSMQIVEQFCTRAMLIENSEIQHIGNSGEIAARYEEMFLKEQAENQTKQKAAKQPTTNNGVSIVSVDTTQHTTSNTKIKAYKQFTIEVKVRSQTDLQKVNIGVNVKNKQGNMLFVAETRSTIGPISLHANKTKRITVSLDNLMVNGGYIIGVGVADISETVSKPIVKDAEAASFTVIGSSSDEKAVVISKYQVKQEDS